MSTGAAVTQFDLVFRARRAVTAVGEVARSVGVTGGRIVAVEPYDSGLTGARTVELGADTVLLPGLVDGHVHVNEPGRTEWEGFDSATRAAAAGGVTTILDMPLNSIPPTVDAGALAVKRAVAEGRCHVDVGFWGGVIPGNVPRLRGLHDAGVFGFKCFLAPSGVDEFPHVTVAELREALGALRSCGALTIVHAEDPTELDRAPAPRGRSYAAFLASRPRGAENVAIERVIELARETGARVHILHLSSSDALPVLAAARRDGVRVTAETCPHYLTFTAEEVPDGATQYKCCPPIREAQNRELLWRGLADGVIDCVVSDHSPCPAELKRLDLGDFAAAWGGISSLQLRLPAVWTQARGRGFVLADVARWTAQRPAEIAGLARKGRIEPGYDADFCVFAPDATQVVDPAALWHRNPVTPYAGAVLSGAVRGTWLRGERVDLAAPGGRLLSREQGDA
jgi:allantoinase